MPRFAANLDWLFQEVPFLDRFAAAREAGFRGVEILRPYVVPAEEIARALRHAGVELVLINAAAGDWERGERGLAALPGRERDFADSIDRALDYALRLGCKRVHVMAGLPPADLSPAAIEETYIANLGAVAARLAPHGIAALIEPINRHDMPGYFLERQDQAAKIIRRVGAANLGLQMDIYHCHRVEGDEAARLKANMKLIRHIQIAGYPGRNEPEGGAIDYPALFGIIDGLNYAGWIGAEYRPCASTLAGLGWAAPYGIGAAPG